jgi:hypothetical protein
MYSPKLHLYELKIYTLKATPQIRGNYYAVLLQMIRKTTIIIMLSFIGFSANAQNNTVFSVTIDTLEQLDNKVLYSLKTYADSTLTEEAQAFLYQTTLKIPKFKRLPNLFKKELAADSIVFHGLRTTYLNNRYYKQEQYDNGNLKSNAFYNESGKEISLEEFNKYNGRRGPCGDVLGYFLIHGRKKNN